jgi:eukaryotic-like serine/threonine-protein kinase
MTDPSRTTPAASDQASAESHGPLDPTQSRAKSEPNFAAPAHAGEVGQLGRYRVLQKLGAGGMGAVYLGYDAALERKVALKVMLPQFATDRGARERFLREAKAAAKVHSDHVVTIHDVGEERGVPFIAMEYLLGAPLDQFLKTKGNLALAQALRVVRETAIGLSAAHALGMVHRDIKPGNIWLEAPKGRVKILDFGLARPANDDAHITGSGAVLGTPAYMSPEQGRGLKVDHRTDLFSLGVVLYRLTTGKMPFTGDGAMAVLTSLAVDTPIAPRQLNPELPESVEAVINKLLAKSPAERFQTAKEVIEALVEIERPRSNSGQLPVVVVATPVQPLAVGAQTQNVWEGIEASESVPVPLAGSAETEDAPVAERATAHVAKPARKASKVPLVLASAALLTVCTVLAAVLWWPKKQPEPVAHNPGGDNPTRGGKQQPPVTVPDPDRTAAEYVLSLGGKVKVNGQEADLKAKHELPKEPFRVTGVGFPWAGNVTDADVVHFRDCKHLTFLNLASTKVTDAGLAHFQDCKSLTTLYLFNSQMGDAGMAVFKDCDLRVLVLGGSQMSDAGLVHFRGWTNLAILDLSNTRVTDKGLALLADCKRLNHINVKGTKVTKAAVAEFAKALPWCKIDYGGGTIEPTVVLDPDRTAAEYVLSVGGIVSVNGAGKEIKTKEELPKGPFSLTAVNLAGKGSVTDEALATFKDCKGITVLLLYLTGVGDTGLANFSGCKNLTHVDLGGTRVTDAGLAHFKDCKALERLALAGTQVGAAGLAHFRDCEKLTFLNLHNTRVDDAALAHFKGCKELTYLNAQLAKVTALGVAELAKAHPKCRIEYDGGTIEPKK